MTLETPDNTPRKVVILAPERVLASAIVGPYDVLSSAGVVWPLLRHGVERKPIFEVSTVALQAGELDTYWGLKTRADHALEDIQQADYVILPTFIAQWKLGPDWGFGVTGFEEMTKWVQRLYDGGATICSISSGGILLAEMGLLDGHEVTTHWTMAESLSQLYPQIRFSFDRAVYRVGEDERIWVAGGGTCWQDLVIQIISQEAGPLVAAQTARAYTIFGQRSGQLPFSEWQPKIDHGDSAITRAQMWIDEQYAAQDVLPGAIEASTLADRTFKRRFKAATGLPPTHYLQRVRVEEARMLLETTNMNVEAVAVHVGYFDTAFFRNLFKKFVGLKPSEYRERFSLFSERSQEAEDELGRAVA